MFVVLIPTTDVFPGKVSVDKLNQNVADRLQIIPTGKLDASVAKVARGNRESIQRSGNHLLTDAYFAVPMKDLPRRKGICLIDFED